jgi:hypothetical protein
VNNRRSKKRQRTPTIDGGIFRRHQVRPDSRGKAVSSMLNLYAGTSLLRSVCIGAVAGFLMASCGSHGKSITVDRETFIPDVMPRVDAIARTRNGGFVVTGIGLTAWVVATDSHGTLLWRFIDPIDSRIDTGSQSLPQSEFHGVLPLANGNTLMCGGKYKAGHTVSLLVILDRNGDLIEKRMEAPNDDPRFVNSNFYQCFRWQDGILLLGNANDGAHGYIWLVELDGNGVKQREVLVDNIPAVKAGTAVGRSFVFTAWDSNDNFRVIRANERGETIAKRVIAGEFIVQLRSMVESSQTSVIIYGAGKATLYTLDERLQDARPPKEIANFDVLAGCGYVLADTSIALFGRRPNAAVAWISGQDKTYTMRPFDSKYVSLTVSDAVPISADQFVTVRGSVSQDSRDQGVVMSWVTIKGTK